MIDKKTLAKVKNILSEDTDSSYIKAIDLFCKNTFFISKNEKNSQIFYQIFAPPFEFSKMLGGVLSDLQTNDQTVKLKASRYVRKEAYKENKLSRYKWLTYPKTIEILLASLNKTDDKRVTEETILALGQIVERYSFPDLRIYEDVSLFFDMNSKAIKNAVATTLSKFKTSDKWVYIIELGENTPNRFGQELIVRSARSDVETIPLGMKPKVREILVNMEKSSSIG